MLRQHFNEVLRSLENKDIFDVFSKKVHIKQPLIRKTAFKTPDASQKSYTSTTTFVANSTSPVRARQNRAARSSPTASTRSGTSLLSSAQGDSPPTTAYSTPESPRASSNSSTPSVLTSKAGSDQKNTSSNVSRKLSSRETVNSSPSITRNQSLSNTMQSVQSKASKQNQRTPAPVRPSAKSPKGPPGAIARDDLVACKYCSRRFASDRLGTHEDICSKSSKKKRKVYDPLKHRVQGTELEPYVKKVVSRNPSNKSKQTVPKQKSNWRTKHEEFIATIRAAKHAQAYLASGGKLSDLPPPPPTSNPDYVQCPHCGRKFNETAAERHIPKCATYVYNKPSRLGPPSKASTNTKGSAYR